MNRMNHMIAVFNNHVNEAGKRADTEYIEQFGQKAFEEHIKPFHEKGIMAIFDEKPTIYTMPWVVLVMAFVNEKPE